MVWNRLLRFALLGGGGLEQYAILLVRVSIGLFFAISGANKLFKAGGNEACLRHAGEGQSAISAADGLFCGGGGVCLRVVADRWVSIERGVFGFVDRYGGGDADGGDFDVAEGAVGA